MDPQRALGGRLVGHPCCMTFFNDFWLSPGSPKSDTAAEAAYLWGPGKTPLRHLKQ